MEQILGSWKGRTVGSAAVWSKWSPGGALAVVLGA